LSALTLSAPPAEAARGARHGMSQVVDLRSLRGELALDPTTSGPYLTRGLPEAAPETGSHMGLGPAPSSGWPAFARRRCPSPAADNFEGWRFLCPTPPLRAPSARRRRSRAMLRPPSFLPTAPCSGAAAWAPRVARWARSASIRR